MKIASIINEHYDAFVSRYKGKVLPGHLKALNAMRHCRTPEAGELYVRCPDCDHAKWQPLSCGHRNCPQCQNHETSHWIDRQRNKLLPVHYFMVTFTLPREFRSLAYRNQRIIYSLMFSCVSSTLKDFGRNPKHLGADMGMTMVLHTHSRKLDFHPHIHAVVPAGGIDKQRRQFKKKKGKYLFHQKALAKVFRARILDGLNRLGLAVPKGIRPEWIVDCARVGTGITALTYLSRYLYRGVITERNIVAHQNGQVTFRYTESKTGKSCLRTLKGEEFLRLILRHVLPRGFRRIRDYGFLHSNAKKILALVQLVLHIRIHLPELRPRPAFMCPCCKSSMLVIGFRPPGNKPG
ncbi:MAG: transposase [Desulfobacteraceae bacterium]|nr:MAG: transposase [Desulfobacteraceae bacterium]